MRRALAIALFCWTSGLITSVFAGELIGLRDGLSQSSVNDIVQDQQGFLWVATDDGLNRYDGYEFKAFYHDPEDSLSLAGSVVNTLLIGPEGKLWVGTDLGLSIYNSTSRTFDATDQVDGFPQQQSVKALALDSENNIWIGTASAGVYRCTPQGKLRQFQYDAQDESTLSSNNITAIHHDQDGGVWVGTAFQGLNYQAPGSNTFKRITHSTYDGSSIISNNVLGIVEDWAGNIWVYTDQGASVLAPEFKEDKRLRFQNAWPKKFAEKNWVCLKQLSTGQMLMGFSDGQVGIAEFTPHTFAKNQFGVSWLTSEGQLKEQQFTQIQCGYEDRTGILWVGTDIGLIKVDGNKNTFKHFKTKAQPGEFTGSNNINAIIKTFDGAIYVGTPVGLSKYNGQGQALEHYDLMQWTETSNQLEVLSLFQDYTGKLWMGTDRGVYELLLNEDNQLSGMRPVAYCSEDDDLSLRTKAIYADNQGYLWVGSENGLFRINLVTAKTSVFRHKSASKLSISDNRITCIYQDGKGMMWVGTEVGLNLGLYHTVDSLRFKRYKHTIEDPHSLSNNFVTSVVEDPNGELWLGTYGGGANRFNYSSGQFIPYTDQQGLQSNVVHGILIDSHGDKWMSTNSGLSVWSDKTELFRHYRVADGLQSEAFNPGAYHESEEGELFFGGINGFNKINPLSLKENTIAPIAAITRFEIHNPNEKRRLLRVKQEEGEAPLPLTETESPDYSLAHVAEVILSHKQDNFTISYVGLHFSSPDRNWYQYQLKGFDQGWVLSGQRRNARYNNVPPGDYEFVLRCANPDGVWSDELSIQVTINPPFWQTWWFRIAVIIALSGLVFGVYRARVRLIREQKEVLEYQVKERTAEVLQQKEEIEAQKALLEQEKEKAENLLLNMLPQETVDELKIRGKASARHYTTATVMFTDFKSFTQIAENMRPQELVQELDKYFIKYDEIIEKHGIEKIKTIGDSYMCAGGIPVRNKTNPIDIVLAGKEIQRYMHELKEIRQSRGEPFWEVRIGIHTGELIAGVIGRKRFAYDIWGDTVNVANRMELSGVPGKVNISGTTYEQIKPFFDCTFRGKVLAKNKGEIDMYFVDRIKPHLSINGDGREPNDMFWEYVNLRMYSSINYRRAEKYIIRKLRRNLSQDLWYHGVHHTLDVCHAVEMIAQSEGIKGEDLFLLKTAALYHDAGFVTKYMENEEVGADMARKELIQFGYTPDQIELVCQLILATKVPQKPTTHLEEIICDADLDYLGREDFHLISDSLKREFMFHGIIKSDRHWDEVQIKFLSNHEYFTATAKSLRREKKLKHLEEVKERYEQNSHQAFYG